MRAPLWESAILLFCKLNKMNFRLIYMKFIPLCVYVNVNVFVLVTHRSLQIERNHWFVAMHVHTFFNFPFPSRSVSSCFVCDRAQQITVKQHTKFPSKIHHFTLHLRTDQPTPTLYGKPNPYIKSHIHSVPCSLFPFLSFLFYLISFSVISLGFNSVPDSTLDNAVDTNAW